MTTPTEALHGQIMNIRCRDAGDIAKEHEHSNVVYAYRCGHRDARHAAAELSVTALAQQPSAPSAEPVTLADVLDALNLFNRPKPSEDDGPWEGGHFIRVDYLPDFINVISAAWFAPQQTAPQASLQPMCAGHDLDLFAAAQDRAAPHAGTVGATKHLREVVSHYRQMHDWRLRYQCEDPEPGAERKETTHRIALVLAMSEAEKFLAATPPAAPVPTVQPLTEAQDATRYRWLRHGDNDERCIRLTSESQPYMLRGELLDRCIDEAMAADAEQEAHTVATHGITLAATPAPTPEAP